jgi:hypothetical protein
LARTGLPRMCVGQTEKFENGHNLQSWGPLLSIWSAYWQATHSCVIFPTSSPQFTKNLI